MNIVPQLLQIFVPTYRSRWACVNVRIRSTHQSIRTSLVLLPLDASIDLEELKWSLDLFVLDLGEVISNV